MVFVKIEGAVSSCVGPSADEAEFGNRVHAEFVRPPSEVNATCLGHSLAPSVPMCHSRSKQKSCLLGPEPFIKLCPKLITLVAPTSGVWDEH